MPTEAAAPNPWFSWEYYQTHAPELWEAAQEHIMLTVGAVLLAVAIAVPLTVAIRRRPTLGSPVLAVSGVLYTIPALAMVSFLWPIFGLSPWTVIIALAVYALLVVLRNLLVGLQQVPAATTDAARGMGMADRQIFWQVSVPLALPTILAGLRIATVSTVGLVTIGALVGYGGFGSLILSGFALNGWHAQIMAGTIGCIVLAVVFDLLLQTLQRAVTPWTARR